MFLDEGLADIFSAASFSAMPSGSVDKQSPLDCVESSVVFDENITLEHSLLLVGAKRARVRRMVRGTASLFVQNP